MKDSNEKNQKSSEEKIVPILTEAQKCTKNQATLCREFGNSPNKFYIWKRKYSGMENDNVKKLRELERENMQIKKLLA